MTEQRSLSTGENRCHPLPPLMHSSAAKGIDAAVEKTETSCLYTPPDGAGAQTCRNQLCPREHAVLPIRQLCQRTLALRGRSQPRRPRTCR